MDREEQAQRMAEQRAQGWTYEQIATDHGVSKTTVQRRLNPTGTSADHGHPTRPAPPGPQASKEKDTAEMWRLSVEGWTQREIADHYGIGQPTVSDRLKRYRQNLPETDREMILHRNLAELDSMRRELWRIVEADPAPAYSHGRAVKRDDGTSVLDHSERLAAMDRLLRIQERIARSLGLDAPAKAELAITEQATDAAKQAAARATERLASVSAIEGGALNGSR